eukprot:scaffold3686_cov193-Alexandrium_tamarense.AAC.22
MDVESKGVAASVDGASNPPIPESASEILSTLHLDQRREERNISENELDAAIKHGERTEGFNSHGPAWVFSYGGITYVTDYEMTRGITSWVNPCWGFDLEKVPITLEMKAAHRNALERSQDHSSWNSHAVIVVDQSGSMRKTDATKAVTRSDLVWLCLAVDYVGKRLRSGEATSDDYLSLVELSGSNEYLLMQEPVDWILYNRIIDFLRHRHPTLPGNYLPAIDKAQHLLKVNSSGSCALQLIFLTDGAPSDFSGDQNSTKYEVCNRIASLASRFGSRLAVGGFAVGGAELSTLEAMIETAKEYNCTGFLMKASLRVEDLSSAFRSMSTLITETKTTMTDANTKRQRTYRDLFREPTRAVSVYNASDKEWKKYRNHPNQPTRVERTYFDKHEYCWIYPEKTFNSDKAVGIAVRDFIFGEGKERAVRRVREINNMGEFVGPLLVGKESLFIEDMNKDDAKCFHKNFCKTQQLSQRFASYFNKKLLMLPGVDSSKVPTINFLDCWVMLYNDEDGEKKGILVEKMLNPLQYRKWNTNAGHVHHRGASSGDVATPSSFAVEDIPQAYSHYTYLASKRKFLVCDLQGVLNTSSSPPVFELTDPAIHYKEQTHRINFGRTDLGEEGIQKFLLTHKCSELCRMICKRWLDKPLEADYIQYERLGRYGSVTEDGTAHDKPDRAKARKCVRFAC